MYQSTPKLTLMQSSLPGLFFSEGRFEKNSVPSGALSLRQHILPSNMSLYSLGLRGFMCHWSSKASMPGILRSDVIWSDNGR
jgi:hypothetical protein